MLDRIFRVIQRVLASSERDRLEQKWEHMDHRIDNLEIGQAEIKTEIRSINEVWGANLEALEQKINSSRVSSEALKDIVNTRFDYANKAFERLESLFVSSFAKKD
jgi:vacuolar-type H+-ATPase subunit I/STV1